MPKKGYKWRKKYKINRSRQYIGSGNPFYGKKHSEEVRKKISQFRKGVWNGFGFKKGSIPWNKGMKGIHLSPKSEFKKGQLPKINYRRGENHPCWKGGISKIRYLGTKEERVLKNLERKEKKAGRPKPKNCEICNNIRKIVFDHDHKTNKFRGWICEYCNCALGLVKDNPQILLLLIKYLKKYGK